MLKWLVITLIAVVGFMAILLGLGYLLNENEKATTVLKAQLEQQALAEKRRQQRVRERTSMADYSQRGEQSNKQVSKIVQPNIEVMAQFEQTVIDNLTCVSSSQCHAITVSFKNSNCTLAINAIGASLMRKINTQSSRINACPAAIENADASCQQNVCTLVSSGAN